MKKNYQVVVCSIIVLIGLLISGIAEASELNFGVSPTIPDFQVDRNKTYFDLKVEKNQEKELEVVLKNQTKKAVTVEIDFNRATTNINGVVEYGPGKIKEDPSLKHNIEKLVTFDNQEVTIPPASEKKVAIHIKAPKEDFSGVLASGLTFKEKSVADESTSGQGMAIKNEYAYVVALILHGNVEQRDIPSELALNKVEAGQVNVRNVIFANLQNPQPKYLNKLSVAVKIYKQNSDKMVYSSKNEGMQMAPNTNFDYPVHLEGKRLEAGKYTLKLQGASKDDKWDLEQDFTITREEAKKLNDKDVTIKPNYTWWYVGGLVTVLLISQLILLYLVKKGKRKSSRKRSKTKKSRSKKKEKD